jgi:hypothetical protein
MMGLIALSFLVLPGTNNEKLRYSIDMFGIKKEDARYSEKGYSNDEQMQGGRGSPKQDI